MLQVEKDVERLSIGRLSRTRVLAALAMVAGLVVMAAPAGALAREQRLYAGTLGSATSAHPDPYPLSVGSNEGPTEVAVDDSSGDVYVSDPGHYRVEKFTAAGEFLFMFGDDVNRTAIEEGRTSETGVCPAAGHPADVCQSGISSTAPGAIYGAAYQNVFLAVDNSSGESHGDVYVSDAEDGLVSKFDSSGHLVESWGNNGSGGAANGQLNGSDAAHRFGPIAGVAVDPTGNLWVGMAGSTGSEYNSVYEFTAAGTVIREWPNEFANYKHFYGFTSRGLAVDAEDNVYIPQQQEVVKANSAGSLLGVLLEPSGGLQGVALDTSTGDLYVSTRATALSGEGLVARVAGSCHPVLDEVLREGACSPVETFGAGLLTDTWGLAVDSSGSAHALYVTEPTNGRVAMFSAKIAPDVVTGEVSDLSVSGARLNGTVDADGVPLSECFFEWGATGEAYSHKTACEPAAGSIPVDSNAHPVTAEIGGLAAGATYRFRLVAANANDVNESIDEPSVGGEQSFGPPQLQSVSTVASTAATATLRAVVDPFEADTEIHFEYGSEPGVYSVSTPLVDAGAGDSYVTVSEQLSGLSPHTVYYYRVVAESVLGSAISEEGSFTTQTPGAFAMLDNRVWELVSPPNKQGAQLEPLGYVLVQAAADGDALAYAANGPIEPEPAGNGATWSEVLAARGADGWSSKDLAIPHEQETGSPNGVGYEYRFFSSDLSRSIVQPIGSFTPLSAEATEQTAYLRNDFAPGGGSEPCTVSCYEPLVTAGNVPAGTEFGVLASLAEAGSKCTKTQEPLCGPQFVGANPAATSVVLQSVAPLVEGAPRDGLYEWSDGGLLPVSVLPESEGGGYVPTDDGPVIGGYEHVGASYYGRGAVSDDGSRVFFSEEEGHGHLYLRDTVSGETVRLDRVQGGTGAGVGSSLFQFASSDGSRVFFTDEQRLTANAGAEGEGEQLGKPDLYECAIVEGAGGELACELSDLTPKTGGGESADVRGSVIGASESGEDVYFVANGVLASNRNAHGETASPGDCTNEEKAGATCNLYVNRNGVTTFIATLSGADERDWGPRLEQLTARVSPDGEWLAFMSQRSLTGYDNRDAVSGEPDQEVFLYHAATGAGEVGSVVCASCNPTGARPHGAVGEHLKLAGGFGVWSRNASLAANVPAWTRYTGSAALYQSRYLSDAGRLFFDSSDDLVPQDTNGTEDVYEYEPPGVGSCTSASTTFGGASDGCVDLISSGTSPQESAFLDASESGDDVFFLTYAQLSGRDVDTSLDVYDARVGGGEPEVARPVECQGDACQAFVAPPEELTPGTLIHSGLGNLPVAAAPGMHTKAKTKATAEILTRERKLREALKLCRKDKAKARRIRCERKAHAQYGAIAKNTKGRRK